MRKTHRRTGSKLIRSRKIKRFRRKMGGSSSTPHLSRARSAPQLSRSRSRSHGHSHRRARSVGTPHRSKRNKKSYYEKELQHAINLAKQINPKSTRKEKKHLREMAARAAAEKRRKRIVRERLGHDTPGWQSSYSDEDPNYHDP